MFKEILSDQEKLSWWLSFSLLLRCVWNDLTLGAWWGVGGEWSGPATQSSQNCHQDRWSRQILCQGGQEGRKGPTASRLWLQRNMRLEAWQTLSLAWSGQKPVGDHISNLHSTECNECYLRCPSIIKCIFLASIKLLESQQNAQF